MSETGFARAHPDVIKGAVRRITGGERLLAAFEDAIDTPPFGRTFYSGFSADAAPTQAPELYCYTLDGLLARPEGRSLTFPEIYRGPTAANCDIFPEDEVYLVLTVHSPKSLHERYGANRDEPVVALEAVHQHLFDPTMNNQWVATDHAGDIYMRVCTSFAQYTGDHRELKTALGGTSDRFRTFVEERLLPLSRELKETYSPTGTSRKASITSERVG